MTDNTTSVETSQVSNVTKINTITLMSLGIFVLIAGSLLGFAHHGFIIKLFAGIIGALGITSVGFTAYEDIRLRSNKTVKTVYACISAGTSLLGLVLILIFALV